MATSVDHVVARMHLRRDAGRQARLPGTSTLNQIEKVGEVIGAPSGDAVAALQSTFVTNMLDQMLFPNGELGPDGKRAMLPFSKASPPEPNSQGQGSSSEGGENKQQQQQQTGLQLKAHSEEARRATWSAMYPKASDDAIDLLERLMQYDPKRRLTAAEGLQHNYCSQFHDPESEVTYAGGAGRACRSRCTTTRSSPCPSTATCSTKSAATASESEIE